MKKLIIPTMFSLLLAISATGQQVSLLKAAELTTACLSDTKLAGKPMAEFFEVTGLVRTPPEHPDADGVEWLAMLTQTTAQRAGVETMVMLQEDGKLYRRVLEIRKDGTVVIAKILGGLPRARVVPPAKK
ncbi:MAG: hypothetical protein EOP85_10485 [Verrucomicrobiaceae bacterium]|nr:MAG: hypothetical protein EOP85_10485 [Verrucomicrobiaceae bacterium]